MNEPAHDVWSCASGQFDLSPLELLVAEKLRFAEGA